MTEFTEQFTLFSLIEKFKTMNAIIVGATSGIGKEVALLLLREGWNLGLAGRRTELLADLEKEYPSQVKVAHIDICAEAAVEAWNQLAESLGGVDLYLHSSGVGWYNPDLDVEKEIKTAVTNVEGFIRMTTAAYHYFKRTKRAGQIAAISSIAGTRGLGAAPAYSATKKLQHTYLEALSQLSKKDGLDISFTDIRPGFVRTAFLSGASFPMQMEVKTVAQSILGALKKRKTIAIIDWRYRCIVALWRMLPRWLWVRIRAF